MADIEIALQLDLFDIAKTQSDIMNQISESSDNIIRLFTLRIE